MDPAPAPDPDPGPGTAKAIQQSAVTRSPGGAASKISATHRRCGDASSSEAACGTVAAIARRRPRATARWVAPGASAMVTLERAARSEPEGPSRISAGAGGPPSHAHQSSPRSNTGSATPGSEKRNDTSASRAGTRKRGVSRAAIGVGAPGTPDIAPAPVVSADSGRDEASFF